MEAGGLPGGLPATFVSQMLAAESVPEAQLILSRWLPGIVEVDRVVVISHAGEELRRALLKSGLISEIQPALIAHACVSGAAIRERRSIKVPSTTDQQGDDCATLALAGLRSSLHVPLTFGNTVFGALELAHHRAGFFTDTHVEQLEAAASLLAAVHFVQEAPNSIPAANAAMNPSGPVPVQPGTTTSFASGNHRSLLRSALLQGEIESQFQPSFRYVGLELVSVEALARWRGDHSLKSASEFLPSAPTMTQKVTLRVADQVVAVVRELVEHGVTPPQFMINVAGQDLARMLEWFESQAVPAGSIGFEIPMIDALGAFGAIEEMMLLGQARGIEFTLDDVRNYPPADVNPFALPVGGLKLEMSLTRTAVADDAGRNYVSRLVNMARRRGLRVSAKGVETREQAEALRSLGVNRMQGYFFLPPVGRSDLLTYLAPRSNLVSQTNG